MSLIEVVNRFERRGNLTTRKFGLRTGDRERPFAPLPPWWRAHANKLFSRPSLTPSVTHQEWVTIRDQGQRGSCVQNACGEAIHALQVGAGRPAPVFPSREAGDYLCRVEDGNTDLTIDTGTFVRTAADVYSKYGFADEILCPYGTMPDDISTRPNGEYLKQAWDQSNEVGRSQTVFLPLDYGTDLTVSGRSAIENGGFLVWAGDVSNQFAEGAMDFSLPIGPPATPADVDGGHCMFVVGYRTESDGSVTWVFANSWGTNFALKGFFLANSDFLASASELYALSHVEVEGVLS